MTAEGTGRAGWRGWLRITRSTRLGAVVGIVITAGVALYPVYDRYRGCEPDDPDDPIVMVSGEDLNPGRRRHQLIEDWNKTHKPPVRLVELPGGTDQERSEMLASQQVGSCAYDVFNLDVVWIPEFIRAGYLKPLPVGVPTPGTHHRFDWRKFLPKPWQTGTGDDGKQYAIPFHTDVGLLYYRKDIVEQPPRTWEELREMTERAKRKLPSRNAAGLVTQLAEYEGLTVNGMEAVWAAGGEVRYGNNRIAVDAHAVQGLQRLVSDVSSLLVSPASAGYREADTIKAFTSGQALFMRNWPYAYAVLAADPVTKRQTGIAELPGPSGATPGPGALGGQSLAISKNTGNEAAARELIAFLTQKDQQQVLFACGGYVPVAKQAYQDLRPCSLLPGQQRAAEEDDPLDQRELRELAAILQKALARARTRPAAPDYPTFSRAFHRYLHDSITSRTAVDGRALVGRLTACSGAAASSPDCP